MFTEDRNAAWDAVAVLLALGYEFTIYKDGHRYCVDFEQNATGLWATCTADRIPEAICRAILNIFSIEIC
jgi:hypothetical protein